MNQPSFMLSIADTLARHLLEHLENELQTFVQENIRHDTRQPLEQLLASCNGILLKKMIVYSMITHSLAEYRNNRMHHDLAVLKFDSITNATAAFDQLSEICDFLKNKFSVELTITQRPGDKELFCNF